MTSASETVRPARAVARVLTQRGGQVHDVGPTLPEKLEYAEPGGMRQCVSHPGGVVGAGQIQSRLKHRGTTLFDIPNRPWGRTGYTKKYVCH